MCELYGISEAFNHLLEWKSRGGGMINRKVCPTLRSTDYKCPKYVWYMEGKETKSKMQLPPELDGKKFRIRKLTPRECFRLMGVDDEDIDKIQSAGISNSSQYKLAGNSIVVDVLFHLFRKMFIETGVDFDGKPKQLKLF